ncbi:MAG: tRNA (N6-isopentenyl adenosine(37)-C2)-methylthiotransferase MiaB [Planctomycetaceae bacterium]|nr:tRNA (N6-isopentenyl adenosine(37)-C2)-methylthiotransferase MiaB [Planctomycetaceae bacterium]GIK51848.1 MAG: tRNA-2-methylthio-N(6)-dimethylallyladenosine synthase [Planctomycetota bacterium]
MSHDDHDHSEDLPREGVVFAPGGVPGKSAYMLTFGCQMNVLDSELAMATLAESGLGATDAPEQAEVILVNTCSVRDKAEQKAYSFLGRMKRLKKANPHVVIGVLGCMAQKEGELIFKRAPYVDIVAGTRHFTRIDEYVRRVREGKQRILALGRDDEVVSAKRYRLRDSRHSLQVAVMRGCDHHCTFCVVPNTRGIEQSKPFDEVVKECEILVGAGAREITLLGQNIDSYGKRLSPRRTLAELLHAVSKIPGLDRLRFITSHPADLKPELLEAFREIPNLMPYLHFPAQSGSDRILRAMRRGYSADDYLRLVDQARAACPEIGLAGDTIVGFPTETDTDFERTVELHRRVEYQNAFIFAYSHRAFTPAEKMNLADDIPEDVKSQRVNELIRQQREISARVLKRYEGRVLPVLVDSRVKTVGAPGGGTTFEGRSPQNNIVHFDSGRDLTGEIVNVKITRTTGQALYGQLA